MVDYFIQLSTNEQKVRVTYNIQYRQDAISGLILCSRSTNTSAIHTRKFLKSTLLIYRQSTDDERKNHHLAFFLGGKPY